MKIAVLGIGNILKKDDGIGIKAVKYLETYFEFSPEVILIDGGTVGMGLSNMLVDLDFLIVIDAINAKGRAGEINLFNGEEFQEVSAILSLSPHQITFLDLIMALNFESRAPKEWHLIGIIPECTEHGIGFSPALENAFERIIDNVLNMLAEKGISATKRKESFVFKDSNKLINILLPIRHDIDSVLFKTLIF
ncbi:hydrogenase maturation protease [Candidatus Magnetomoraceae bacterium gMMP-15]